MGGSNGKLGRHMSQEEERCRVHVAGRSSRNGHLVSLAALIGGTCVHQGVRQDGAAPAADLTRAPGRDALCA